MPGTCSNTAVIFSESSGKVLAEVHSFLSFKITIMSPASKGIGSVGISALPIFVTTFVISGKLANKSLTASCVEAIELFKLLPVKRRVSTAKSPSSRDGINSPPILDNKSTATPNNITVVPITSLGIPNTFCKMGWYFLSIKAMSLSVHVFL